MAESSPTHTPDYLHSFQHFSLGSKFLYEGENRFDAKSYSEGAFRALHAIEACPYPKMPLSELVKSVYHPTESQPRSNFKRIWVKEGEGVPFLTGAALFFLRPEKLDFLSPRMEKLPELMIPMGAVLLSRSGTTGRPVLVNRTLSKFAITDDAIRVFPNDVPIGYIYAFLATSLVHTLVTRKEYGATVSHLEAKHVTGLPVPIVERDSQEAIHRRVVRVYELRDEANDLLEESDRRLHESLGIEPFSERDIQYVGRDGEPRAFSISSVDLGIRLDAGHHVPIARSAVSKLESGQFRLVRLGDRVERVYVAPRFPRVYVESQYGTPLLQGRHIPLMRIYDLKCISNTNTPRMERWIIETGWVLVTCSGTIGRIALSTERQNGWAASQHILRIVPRSGMTHPGFLAAFLSSPFGQHQLKAKIYGGVVDELTEDDVEDIWIPDVPYEEQATIGEPVVKAYELRDSANALEDNIIMDLEELIIGKKAPLKSV